MGFPTKKIEVTVVLGCWTAGVLVSLWVISEYDRLMRLAGRLKR